MHLDRSLFRVAFLFAFALASPATAGTVYVAMVSDSTAGGLTYESVLRVTNTGAEPHFFVVHFLPSFADGTARDEAELTPIGVPAGHTYVYENLSLGSGKTGMLEITGDDELVFSASLVVRGPDGATATAPVPVVGSEQVFDGGRSLVIQGVQRDHQRLTSYGLVNFSHEDSSCDVDLFAADGAALIDTVTLAMPPLSHFFWRDVVAVAGLPSAADARFEAVCGGPAFAFAQVVDLGGGELASIEPSASLSSRLVPPGQEPPGPPEPTPGECGGDFCFEQPGVFFVPSPGNRVLRLPVPIPSGEFYSRLEIEMTVTHGGWFPGNPGGFHNFFWLFDGQWANGTWGYVNARGPGRGIVTSLHNVNLQQGRRATANLLLQPGATYRLRYVYDAGAGTIETTFFDAGGAVLARMTDAAAARRIVFGSEAGAWLWFGLEGHFEEVPSYGWQYRNFVLSLTK
jgi:hypothetical protein